MLKLNPIKKRAAIIVALYCFIQLQQTNVNANNDWLNVQLKGQKSTGKGNPNTYAGIKYSFYPTTKSGVSFADFNLNSSNDFLSFNYSIGLGYSHTERSLYFHAPVGVFLGGALFVLAFATSDKSLSTAYVAGGIICLLIPEGINLKLYEQGNANIMLVSHLLSMDLIRSDKFNDVFNGELGITGLFKNTGKWAAGPYLGYKKYYFGSPWAVTFGLNFKFW